MSEPNQIDMMDEDELRESLRSVVKQLVKSKKTIKQLQTQEKKRNKWSANPYCNRCFPPNDIRAWPEDKS